MSLKTWPKINRCCGCLDSLPLSLLQALQYIHDLTPSYLGGEGGKQEKEVMK